MSFNFNPSTFDNKPNSFRLSEMFHQRSRYVALIASCLVIRNTDSKFLSVFLPFGHGIGLVIHVFILSTWLNNNLIYPRVYYINVDNTTRETNREEKGRAIATNPNRQIFRINDYTYHVKSQTTKREYDVIHTEKGWICSCPDSVFRHVDCKHCLAVEFSIKIRNEVRERNKVVIE